MTHDEMIQVIQAHKEGKTIECLPRGATGWRRADPRWDFSSYDYRVKPEPRVVWVNEYKSGVWGEARNSKEDAIAAGLGTAIRIRKFIEVLED